MVTPSPPADDISESSSLRLKAECAKYVSDMRLTAERNRLTLASRKEAEVEERRSVLRAATRRHR